MCLEDNKGVPCFVGTCSFTAPTGLRSKRTLSTIVYRLESMLYPQTSFKSVMMAMMAMMAMMMIMMVMMGDD